MLIFNNKSKKILVHIFQRHPLLLIRRCLLTEQYIHVIFQKACIEQKKDQALIYEKIIFNFGRKRLS